MTTLGKYEIVQELGTGSMGVIYRARDTILDRDVALKTIARAGSLDPELKERFYREARACAKLQHPNIVTVYDLGEQEGCAFIAMELLVGVDLRRFITEKRALPVDVKLELAAGVCEGLHHAHSHGIIHRDIKPSNVFLNDDGRAKLLDFGVARLPTSSLTMMGRVLGTPHYMAPEQIMGKQCDARSDVFSLAIVFFEFLTYSHPFFGESIPKRILHEAPDSLLARNPQLPLELQAVIGKALEKDPTLRYQTAAEFAEALRSVLNKIRGTGTGTGTGMPVAGAFITGPASVASVSFPSAEPALPEVRMPANANTEYKMSALLTALQEFDNAIEQQNVRSARSALEIIRKVAAIDDRFQTALRESIKRLQDLEASVPPEAPSPPESVATPELSPVPEQPTRGVPEPVKRPVSSEAPLPTGADAPSFTPKSAPPAAVAAASAPDTESPRVEHTFSGGDATSLFGAVKAHPVPASPAGAPQTEAPKPAPPADVRAKAPAERAEPAASSGPAGKSTAPPTAPQPAPTFGGLSHPARSTAGSKKTILIVGAVVAALILAGGIAAYMLLGSKRVVVLPSVATAEVAGDGRIFSVPLDSADVVATVRKGDKVNVIRAPRSRAQEWVEVQYVSGANVFSAGAMRTVNLTNWESTKPDVELSLLQIFGPGEGATETELRAQIARYSDFVTRIAGSAQEARARLDMARLNIQLARLEAAAGRPNGPEITAAARDLGAIQNNAELAGAVQHLRTELQTLEAAAPHSPSSPSPAAPPPLNAAAATKRAEGYWEDGEYDQAERLLRRVLREQPGYDAARVLLDKVQRAKQLEGRE